MMTKLKPQLIVAGPNKKKGGFVSGIGYFLVLIIVFVLGVYVGMGVNNTDFDTDQLSAVNDDSRISSKVSSVETKQGTIETAQEKQIATDQDIFENSTADSNSNQILAKTEESNSELPYLDDVAESDSPIVVSSVDERVVNTDNGSEIFFDNPLDERLVEQDSYRLQVAAFGSIDQANEVVSDLKLRGYDAYIVTTSNSRGEVWNLIKVGNFNTAQEAWNYSTIYQSKEGGEVFVESLSKGRVYNESLEENNDTL